MRRALRREVWTEEIWEPWEYKCLLKLWHWRKSPQGESVDRRRGPGWNPEGTSTLTDFIEKRESAKETEEMTFRVGRKPVDTSHDPSKGERFKKEAIPDYRGTA